MEPTYTEQAELSRRRFLARSSLGLGAAALASLSGRSLVGSESMPLGPAPGWGKAKRVIYLHQSGAPSQIDLFDHKPGLRALQGSELPDSIRNGQRLTGMTSGQDSFPIAASKFAFKPAGESGAMISELLPRTAGVADKLCIIRSLHTEAINHDPAITFFQTGFQQPGRPSMGSWLSYGLGTDNENLPAFVVLISQGSSRRDSQPLFARLWGSGFLPSEHQGVPLRAGEDPVLYLSDPPGVDRETRRRMLDRLAALNEKQLEERGDPEIAARIAQYEMAFRMQIAVPDLVDLSAESPEVFKLYGEDARRPGSYAANCLLARRLVERGVRFVQLYHRGWDQHENLPSEISLQCKDTDQASAALIQDLDRLGLLEDTLVIWGGEFGRTVYCQGPLSDEVYGRDHHPRCFSGWLAGAGVNAGTSYGETDDFSYNIVKDPVHVHDFHATILHCLGIDHEQLTYRHKGRDFRLTDVQGTVVRALVS